MIRQIGLASMLIWTGYLVFQLYLSIVTNCHNTNLLGWDPSARFSTSLKIADSLRNGNFWKPIFIFLDSPTWPSLRNFGESICILLWGPSPSISNNITFFTFFMLLLTVAGILFKSISSIYRFIFYFLFFLITIFQSKIFLTYAYSGMLEIQGSLTLLLCMEGLFFLFSLNKISNYAKWILPISCFLLLQTKYPYALMFLFSLTIYYALMNIKEIHKLIIIYFHWFWNPVNRRPVLFFLPIPILILILDFGNFLPHNSKMRLFLVQLTIILLTIDISHFIHKRSTYLPKGLAQLSYLWFFVYIPSLFWILIHPDRFNSLFSTLQHKQGGSNSLLYFQTILKDISIYNYFWIFIIGFFFFFAYLTKADLYKKRFTIYLNISFWILIGQILTTENHQERHIYHIYPSLILVVIFFFEEFFNFISSKFANNKQFIYLYSASLFLLIFYVIVGNYSKLANLSPICYVENKSDVSYVPSWTKKWAESFLNSPTILINDLNENHINRPDSQLILELAAYRNKIPLSIQPKQKINLREWDKVVRISNVCSRFEVEKFLEKRIESEFTLEILKEESLISINENPPACIEKYNIF